MKRNRGKTLLRKTREHRFPGIRPSAQAAHAASSPEYVGGPVLVYRRAMARSLAQGEVKNLLGALRSQASFISGHSSRLKALENQLRGQGVKKAERNTAKAKWPWSERDTLKHMEKLLPKGLKKYMEKHRTRGPVRYYRFQGPFVKKYRPPEAERMRIHLGFPREAALHFVKPRQGKSGFNGRAVREQPAEVELALIKRKISKPRTAHVPDPHPLIQEAVAREVREVSRAQFNSVVDQVYNALRRKLYIEKERRR